MGVTMTNRERLLLAIRAKATERFETLRRERSARVRWLEQAIERWDYARLTWEQFTATPLGKPLARRAKWALRKA